MEKVSRNPKVPTMEDRDGILYDAYPDVKLLTILVAIISPEKNTAGTRRRPKELASFAQEMLGYFRQEFQPSCIGSANAVLGDVVDWVRVRRCVSGF